jgi:hypothetical protein
VRAREVILGGIPAGAVRVLADELHVPGRAAEQGDGVPGGQSEDVGTGDMPPVGVRVLEVGLDLIDHVEAAERVVGFGRSASFSLSPKGVASSRRTQLLERISWNKLK